MNPDIFFMQEDGCLLLQALNTFALDIIIPEDRRDVLVNAGIQRAFYSKLNLSANAYLFANSLIAQFMTYRVSKLQPYYHPMVKLLEYLLYVHDLEDLDRALFQKLIKQGRENFNARVARSTVGRIEAPIGTAKGTGVLVGQQYLLTCRHIVEHIVDDKEDRAWICFGYETGTYRVEAGETLELDIKNVVSQGPVSDHTQDYALIRIVSKSEMQPVSLDSGYPHISQKICLIHHPRGEPLQISEIGEVVQLDDEVIKHNIEVDYGSSGGPIFNQDWHVIAIHRGYSSSNSASEPDIAEAVPLYHIWKNIEPYLSRL